MTAPTSDRPSQWDQYFESLKRHFLVIESPEEKEKFKKLCDEFLDKGNEEEKTCWGCIYDAPDQESHMNIGGCLYQEDEEQSKKTE